MLLDNTKNGFTLKSNFELRKAYLLFKIISNKTLTNIGKTALEISLKLRLPILFIVKGTVFEDLPENIISDTAVKMKRKKRK